MKKKLLKLTLFIGIILLFENSYSSEINIPTIIIDDVKFQIDPRIEAYNIVAYLADYPFLNGFDIRYRKEIDNYFVQYKNHPAVLNFKRLWMESFRSVDDPIEFVLNCDYSFQPKEKNKDSAQDSLAMYIGKFTIDSDIKQFFKNQQLFYNTILQSVQYNFQNFNEKTRLENYYKYSQNSYTIVLNILGQGNFGIRIKNEKFFDSYIVIAPVSVYGDIPEWENSPRTYNLIWHEFSHTFVNPLVDKHLSNVAKYQYLFDPIKKSMSAQAYQDWTVTVKEHIVRAVASRLAADKYGEDAAYLNHLRGEFGRRFIYVDYISDKLKSYENSSVNFIDYFSQLLEVFSNITNSDIDSLQLMVDKIRTPKVNKIPTLNQSLSDNIKIVYPTNIGDEELRENLKQYIIDFGNRYYPDKPIIADTSVTSSLVKESDLIVFGTIESSLILAKQNFPFIIKSDKIVLDKEIADSNLQMLISWINPYNQQRAMRIFTAQNDSDLIGIHGVVVGDDNFVLMKKNSPIKYGKFINQLDIWFCE